MYNFTRDGLRVQVISTGITIDKERAAAQANSYLICPHIWPDAFDL
jgi:hypothetical protein